MTACRKRTTSFTSPKFYFHPAHFFLLEVSSLHTLHNEKMHLCLFLLRTILILASTNRSSAYSSFALRSQAQYRSGGRTCDVRAFRNDRAYLLCLNDCGEYSDKDDSETHSFLAGEFQGNFRVGRKAVHGRPGFMPIHRHRFNVSVPCLTDRRPTFVNTAFSNSWSSTSYQPESTRTIFRVQSKDSTTTGHSETPLTDVEIFRYTYMSLE